MRKEGQNKTEQDTPNTLKHSRTMSTCKGTHRNCNDKPLIPGVQEIGLLQQTITWYKIRHAGGQAHYYSRSGTLKQRPVTLDWLRSLCFKFCTLWSFVAKRLFECERRSLVQNKRRKSRNPQSGVNKTRFLDLQKQQIKNPRAGFWRGRVHL